VHIRVQQPLQRGPRDEVRRVVQEIFQRPERLHCLVAQVQQAQRKMLERLDAVEKVAAPRR